MNIRDLKYFIHLAESLSFTKTAEAFYVSQPSISIALKRLEEHFETTLLQRNRSVYNIQLTDSGEILYRSSQEILQILDRTKTEIDNSQAESVTIGFLPTIGGYYLPKFLPQLANYTDKLNFVEEESSDLMFEMLRNNQVSLAIIGHTKPEYNEKWVTQIPMEKHELALYVGKNHPLAKQKKLKAKDLEDLNFITLGTGYIHNQIFNEWVKKQGISLNNVRYTTEIQTVSSMLESGLYSAFMSDLLVRDPNSIVRIPIEDAPVLYVSLILNHDIPITSLQKEFNDEWVKVTQDLFPPK